MKTRLSSTIWLLVIWTSVALFAVLALAVCGPISTPAIASEQGHFERTFTVRWHDAVTTAVGPAVLAAVQAQAPGVRLRFLAETDADTNDLRHGQVDLELRLEPRL